ncbi:hypothetical protein CF65_02926 [Aggregatibacter actinomycetemcomitans HK1651]|nr:hypothetical protein CF65_02926 [Aggregatibacter actinomycetemcomitans HK1651]
MLSSIRFLKSAVSFHVILERETAKCYVLDHNFMWLGADKKRPDF